LRRSASFGSEGFAVAELGEFLRKPPSPVSAGAFPSANAAAISRLFYLAASVLNRAVKLGLVELAGRYWLKQIPTERGRC
jgi:hypothetical protein